MTGTDYFKFSLGANQKGEKVFGNRKKDNKLPRNSIETANNIQLQAAANKLGKIEE